MTVPIAAAVLARVVTGRKTGLIRYAAAVARRHRTPQVADIITINDCNLSCAGCIYYGRLKQGETGSALTVADFHFLIDELVAASVPIVSFVGGEPMLNRDLLDAADYANNRGLVTTMVTNATLVDDRMAKESARLFDVVLVSVDGRQEANDAIRGAGSHAKTIEGLRRIIAAGAPVVIVATAIGRLNVRDVVPMMGELTALGVRYFKLQPNIIPKHFPRPPEIEKLGTDLVAFDRAHPRAIVGGRSYIDELISFYRPKGPLPCYANDMAHLSINPDFDVSACCGMFVKVGNVKRDGLRQILRSATVPKVECYGCLSVTLNSRKLISTLF